MAEDRIFIDIQVENKVAIAPQDAFIVCENSNYSLRFNFDKEWNSENIKTARFYYNFSHIDVVFEGNICEVPTLGETLLLKVGVFTDNVKTTTEAEIPCKYSIKKYGGKVVSPSEDVYGQIIELLNKYIEQGGGGGISREEVERIIDEYLAKNPPKDGIDGFSPTITTMAIENGTRVSITDINGTKSFDVLNGRDGTEISVGAEIKELEETQTLVIELKDKQGNVISSAEVVLPSGGNIDLSAYVKNTDRNQFVKQGVTENDITLTDEEKTSASNWFSFVKKAKNASWLAGRTIAYCANFNTNGEPTDATTMQCGNMLDDGLARYSQKRLRTDTPTQDNHCANKKYVDDLIAGLQLQINELKGI